MQWRLKRAAIFCLIVLLVLFTGIPFSGADSATIDFETFTTGVVHAQGGWSSLGPAGSGTNYDHRVVDPTTFGVSAFGTRALRISNAVTSGAFGDQTFSQSLVDAAGETTADPGTTSGGVRQNYFEASWQFTSASPTAEQTNLQVVVSPDRGDGARMSFIRMRDTTSGLQVEFIPFNPVPPPGVFPPPVVVASGLVRDQIHTIQVSMLFVDGVDNDVVTVTVNGNPSLSVTGRSWEDFFRNVEGNPTRTVDSLLFRTAGVAAPATVGNGFLVDNITLTSSTLTCGSTCYANATTGNDGYPGTAAFPKRTIQAAVDAVSTGGTVIVAAGTYPEQVTITRNVTVTGAGVGSVIAPPATWSVDSSLPGFNIYSLVTVRSGATATMSGFAVDGPFTGDAGDGCNDLVAGVYVFQDATLNLLNTDVSDAALGGSGLFGCQTGFGIRFGQYGGGSAGFGLVDTVTITGYQKAGIIIDRNSNVTVEDSTITGIGATDLIAQLGIQVSRGSTAIVQNNQITNNNYTPTSFSASGILMFSGAPGTLIQGNTLTGNNGAVDIISSSETIVKNNTLDNNNLSAVYVNNSENVVVEGNTISNSGVGVQLYSFDADTADTTATVTLNTVTSTSIAVDLTDENLADGEAPNIALNRNSLIGGTGAGSNDESLRSNVPTSMNIECNWWGSAAGPFDDSLSGPGPGSSGEIYTPVVYDFTPWLTAASPLATAPCNGGLPLPTAANDPFTVVDNVPTVLDVLANDTFTAPLSAITIMTPPTNGVVAVTGTAPALVVTYTGSNNYSGPDSFTYTLTDANGTSGVATVTLTVEDCTTTCYVSPTGSNSNSGLTPATAKLTIQAAIDDVDAGGTVIVAAGTYTENVNLNKAVTLEGALSSVTNLGECIVPTDGQSMLQPAVSGTAHILISASDVTVRGMSFTGGTGSAITQNTSVANTDRITVERNYFTNIGLWAVYHTQFPGNPSDNWLTRRNFVDGWVGNNGTGLLYWNMSNVEVTDNCVRNLNSTTGERGIGFDTVNGTATIEGNRIRDLNRWAIQLANSFADQEAVNIRSNIIDRVEVGVQLISLNASFAIRNTNIQDNEIGNVAAIGIWAADGSGGAGRFENITITENAITQNVGGMTGNFPMIDIRLRASVTHGAFNVTNNTINLSGTFPGGAVTSAFGIGLRGAVSQWSVTGNTINGGGVVGTAGSSFPTPTGILLRTVDAVYGTTPASAVVNIQQNVITGFSHGVALFNSVANTFGGVPAGTDININRNDVSANSVSGIGNGGTSALVDGECNWYGSATGPSGEGPGTGTAVSTNIDFTPWLTAASPLATAPCNGGLPLPTAANDPFTVVDNVPTVLDVLANDTFTAPLSAITIVTPPTNGVVAVTGTAPALVVTYTGSNNYSGPDSFTYSLTDANGTSGEATVTLTVEDCTTTCYVSPTGSNSNSGLTPATAKLTIQAAIDDVNAGGTVRVLSGTYNEMAIDRFLSTDGSGPYQFGLFFDVSKPGITLQGVTTADVPITSPFGPPGSLPRINTNATNGFGPSGIFVDAANITIRGVEIGTNASGLNKTIEVIGDNFTLRDSRVDDPEGSVYINDFTAAGTRVQAYTITNNVFAPGVSVDLASGAGLTGPVSGRQITNNRFTNSVGQTWPFISFNGSDTGVPWFVNSVGGAIITGNRFTHTDNSVEQQFIRARGTYDNAQFDWASYWNGNSYNKATVSLIDETAFDLRTFTTTSGSFTFANTRRITGQIQPAVERAQDGDTVLIKNNTIASLPASYPEQVTVTNRDITLRGVAELLVLITPPPTPAIVDGVIAQVTFNGGSVAEMYSLTVDGPIHDDGCAPDAFGVYIHDGANLTASGIAVRDSYLDSPTLYGCQTGIGIFVGGDSASTAGTATLSNVRVTNYQKGGIVTTNAGSSLDLSSSTVSAAAFVQPFIAPNGVQISDGATGSVASSTISGNRCDLGGGACGPIGVGTFQASGIIIFDSPSVTVSNNTITNNDMGVYNFGLATTISGNTFTANRYAGIFADEGTATITSNTIDGGEYGVLAYAYSTTTFPSIASDSVANLSLNVFTTTSVALALIDENPADTFEPVIDANRNSIVGGTGAGSNDESFRNTTTVSMDIECNWWGNAAGPFEDSIGGPGPSSSGEIYGPGDYTPWLAAASPLNTAPCLGGLPLPTAMGDTYTVVDNVPTVLNVLTNDTITPLLSAITILTPPTNGTVTVTGTAPSLVVTYTGNNGYSGPDTFTYTITDSVGVSNTATVSITVEDCTTTCYVSPTGNDNNSGLTPTTAKRTIQAAVDDVSTGGTVRVLAGTYNEQVTVTRSMTIDGDGAGVSIVSTPTSLSVVSGVAAFFDIRNGASVTMTDLTIDGPIHSAGCAPEAVGIYVHEAATLNATAITVDDMNLNSSSLYGCQTGFGIVAGSLGTSTTSGTANLTNVTITDYQKGGIIATNAGSSLTVITSTISAATVVQPFIAPNGIQISDGATGSVTGSTISGNKCDLGGGACGPIGVGTFQASGIIVFDSPSVTVSNNTITDNDMGVYNFGNATLIGGNTFTVNRYAGIFADEGTATITGNTIDGGEYGVLAYAYSTTTFPSIASDSVANLSLNVFTNTSVALALIDENPADTFEPVIDANFNSIVGGTGAGSNDESFRNTTTVSMDIECNWWGNAAGPFADALGGPGPSSSGEIYGPGDFTPWLISSDLSGACTGGAPGALQGTILLQSRLAPSPVMSVPVTVEFYAVGGTTPVYSFALTTDANGVFTTPSTINPGTYVVWVKYERHLAVRLMSVVITSATTTVGSFPVMLAGDASNDNIVDLGDLSIIGPTYDLFLGNVGYDARADFNGDDTTDLLDLSLIGANYEVIGAPRNGLP